MPRKGLEKRREVPSSPYSLRRDKLRREKRTDPAKGLFPLINYLPIWGTEPWFITVLQPITFKIESVSFLFVPPGLSQIVKV